MTPKRLDGEPLLSGWTDILANMDASELSSASADDILAGRLRWDYKDPFEPDASTPGQFAREAAKGVLRCIRGVRTAARH